MKRILFVFAIALLALAVFPAAAEEAVAAPADDAEVVFAEPLFQDEARDAVVENCTAGAIDAAYIPPPPDCGSVPSCTEHHQCNFYCGYPRYTNIPWGYCSSGCCTCAG